MSARRKRDDTESLGRFMRTVEEGLSALSSEELQERLRAHARTLPRSRRAEFLTLLEPAPAPAGDDFGLFTDIDDLVEAIREGDYYDGYGWDHELREERSFGDESWVDVMDELFDRVHRAFLAGESALAADGYGRLLGAFLLDEEEGMFCGGRPATEMVRTDVREAVARHLRALYECTPPGKRAEVVLRAAAGQLEICYGACELKALRDARETPLEGFDVFLEEIAARLRAGAPDPEAGGWQTGTWRREWLREAVELAHGVEGLAELAREEGGTHAEAFYSWVDALSSNGRAAEAIDAAREGVERIENLPKRAQLADHLAVLARGAMDPDLERWARRQAWRSDPGRDRLVALLQTADSAPERGSVVEEEHWYWREAPEPLGSTLQARIDILRGDYDTAIDRLKACGPLGWSRGGLPGYAVLPVLLVAGAGRFEPPAGSVLEELWELVPEEGRSWYGPFDDDGPPDLSEGFLDLLREALSLRPFSPEQRERALAVARETGLRRIRAIVGGTKRGAYDKAARIAVATAEAEALVGRKAVGIALIEDLHAEFPRHSAFRKNLRYALSSSPLLSR